MGFEMEEFTTKKIVIFSLIILKSQWFLLNKHDSKNIYKLTKNKSFNLNKLLICQEITLLVN